MAERKKRPTVGATVAPPNEKADFLTQLQGTFERGVVSAEIDIGGLISEKGGGGSVNTMFGEATRISEGPAAVGPSMIKRIKEIASVYKGQLRTHAPMQADPSALMSVSRTKAANLLKQSLDYTQKIGGKHMTVHPIGPMSYSFIEPFLGTAMPVSNPFMLSKDEKELTSLLDKFHVNDKLLRRQLKDEWKNFVQVIPMTFAEKFGSLAVQDFQEFSENIVQARIGEAYGDSKGDIKKFNENIRKISNNLAPKLRKAFAVTMSQINSADENTRHKFLEGLNSQKELFQNRANELFERVSFTSMDPISNKGETIIKDPELIRLEDKHQKNGGLSMDELLKARKLSKKYSDALLELRLKAWKKVIGGVHSTRFGPFEDSQRMIMENVEDTFNKIISAVVNEKGATYKAMKNGKLTIGIENLFPMNPNKGYMQGFAHFYEPKAMAELIKNLRKIAKRKGLPEKSITMTFDIGHAATSGFKPSDFLKKLKKEGVNPKYVHIVGGPGYGHGHIAWGDWLDEVSKMDPGILEKLMDVGAINIEGGLGHYDAEVTLNAMWDRGLPVEAMMAMAGGPEADINASAMRSLYSHFSGYGPTSNQLAYSQGFAGSSMPVRSFYSFKEPMTQLPMRGSFGSYTMPGRAGGGYTIGPSRTSAIWSSSQPMLYSSKNRD